MRHSWLNRGAFLAALSLVGCFDAHARDGEDAGRPPGDGGPVIRNCSDAAFAPAGATCDFEGSCPGAIGSCDLPSTIQCIDGRIRVIRAICTIAPVRSCDEYFSRGGTDTFCQDSDFAGCVLEEEDCCFRRIECSGNRIVDETSCSECEPGSVCPGYAPPPPEFPACNTSSDCEGGSACSPAGAPRGCGACRIPERECESDAACGPGSLCVEEVRECSCSGPDSLCALDCRLAESDPCEEGSRCGLDGRCAPIDCADGWSCEANTRCHDGAGSVDAHGCGRLSCTDASGCDCGVCMDGQCQDGPGACLLPVP